MKYLVSILIPTYNRSVLLKHAIKSALKQDYKNIEIIVLDNCSTDNTKLVVSEFTDSRIKYFVNEKNIGPILNWREALKKAKGNLSVILCDDDYFIDNSYISSAVKIFYKYDSINLVITDCIIGKPDAEHRTYLQLNEYTDGLTFLKNFWTKNFNIPVISNVFKTFDALQLEPFENNNILYSDIELWLKLMAVGDVGYVNRPSVYYRFHGNNIVTSLSNNEIIKNAKFIKNVCKIMQNNIGAKKISYKFIEIFRCKLVHRYMLFTLNINNKGFYKLYEYKLILQESFCEYNYARFIVFIVKRIPHIMKNKIRMIVK